MDELSSNNPSDPATDLAERIVRYLEGDLSDSETVRLRSRLASDPAGRELFVALSVQRCGMRRLLSRDPVLEELGWDPVETRPPGLSDAMILPALREPETTEPDDRARPEPSFPTPNRSRFRPWMAAAIVLVGLGLIGAMVASRLTRGPAAFATLDTEAAAKWDGVAPQANGPVPANTPLILSAGCIRLTFADRTSVIIEGPAHFTLVAPHQIHLSRGRLSAVVPGGGFAVTTPDTRVTDLGTEFGVEVLASGGTEVEVFRGRVRAESLAAGETAGRILSAGEAARVRAGIVRIETAGAVPQRFVRSLQLPSDELDVVDLLCGGDGTTDRRGLAIDPRTGAAGRLTQVGNFPGNRGYHPVPLLPVVDGCFVPDGSQGATKVDSAGDTFAFPATNNSAFNLITAGGPIPEVMPRPVSTVLGGVDYAAAGRGMLALHSNKGLTLDLAVVRRLHPGASVLRFNCVAGNSWTPLAGQKNENPHADLYVLVDGRSRFERRGFTPSDGTFQVNVPLQNADRFLTLAVTDGGDGISSDWVILGDPRLSVQPPADSLPR